MEKLFDIPPGTPINKGKPYLQEQLELIFSLPPTKKNAEMLAKILNRTPEAIIQQWQWALLTNKAVKEKGHNPDHMPNRKVAKQFGRIQTG